ncbi:MAG: O-antigen polymerase [Chloroflexota bacterium]|nr:O-antigen ligase family protein [Ardenticatenaceae bacterium]GIK55187.1 MAG: O-antigen polymerase [Chloroflexota bacterium]
MSLSRSRTTWPSAGIFTAVLLGILVARLPLVWAVGLVGGTAVLLLTFINPLVGLFAALLAAPWGAWENIVWGPSLLDSGQFLLLVTLAVWLGRGLAYRRIFIPRTFLTVPLVLFIFVSALSLLNAASLSFGFKELLKWLEITAVMLLVVDLFVSREPLAANRLPITAHGLPLTDYRLRFTYYVLTILLLAGLSQALIGIWQFGLRGDGPEHFLVLGRFYRAYGTFEQPNPYAGYMNLTALLAMGTFLGAIAGVWQRVASGRWQGAGVTYHVSRITHHAPLHLLTLALFTGVTAVLCTLAVLFSWSRGAWLSLAVGGAMMLLFWPKKLWQGVTLLLLAGLFFWSGVQVGVVPTSITERITSFSEDLRFGDVRGVDINDANYAVLERLAHWQAALDMARDHIWLGVGFGNYEPVYAQYALINWPYPLGHAHNYYLNTLAETGVLGLAAYVVLWMAVFLQTICQLRQLDWPLRGMALGLLGAWTAVTVHHLVDKLYVNNIYIHLGVMFGLLQLLEHERRANSTKEGLNQMPVIR